MLLQHRYLPRVQPHVRAVFPEQITIIVVEQIEVFVEFVNDLIIRCVPLSKKSSGAEGVKD